MNSKSLPFTEQDLNRTVVGLFVQIARQFPDQVAVKSARQSITYRALDQRSSSMGRFLAAHLGLMQQPVALLIEDKADMTVAILAVIRTGHFYSALRPSDPPTRLTNMLNDLGASILLVSEGMLPLARAIAPPGCRVVTDIEATDADDSSFLAPVTPESLTGIFYTSGSTGEPKGVPHVHQNLLLSANRKGLYLTYGPEDRLLLMYPFSSAASLPFIFNALLNGATLIFFDTEKSLASLAETLLEEHITIFRPPLPLLRSFLDILPPDTIFPDIRYVFTLGDVLYRRDVERLWPHLSQQALIFHMLASSESGTLAGNILRQGTPLDGDILPVGFPLPGKEPVILNEQHQIVPPGEAGEIAVRTDMLFPGYWQRPDLNSQKYVPDPADPSRQLFLTGDIGRFRPDGQLEFIGRTDFRVKIRGFNVDMSAIESVLMSIPEIQHAVVLPWADQDGDKRLVAYLSWALPASLPPGELREKLAQRLPDYMHPAAFITLDTFPLTVTGKIDRKALPAPDWNRLRQETAYIAPRNETEKDRKSVV
jgi:amino acid adenylation domain-containing protein